MTDKTIQDLVNELYFAEVPGTRHMAQIKLRRYGPVVLQTILLGASKRIQQDMSNPQLLDQIPARTYLSELLQPVMFMVMAWGNMGYRVEDTFVAVTGDPNKRIQILGLLTTGMTGVFWQDSAEVENILQRAQKSSEAELRIATQLSRQFQIVSRRVKGEELTLDSFNLQLAEQYSVQVLRYLR